MFQPLPQSTRRRHLVYHHAAEVPRGASRTSDDFRLFVLTFAAGFAVVSVLIA
jgi:hypothetical protein